MKNHNKNTTGKAALGIGLIGLTLLGGLQTAQAGDVADALQALAGNDVISRKVSLADLGMTAPLALSSSAAARDIYIPVPKGVSLIEPNLSFKGTYMRADGGRTTYVLSLDGYPVAARSPENDGGKTDFDIGVDGTARDNGFVHLGIEWSSSIGQFYCDDARPIGNQLIVQPDSYLEYSYNAADVKTVASAFSALPQKVVLLVADKALDRESYDAAWRLGVALERAGKQVEIMALPAVGTTVDTSGLAIPEPLRTIPAFAMLSKGGPVKISDPAETGALLLLGAPALRADVAIAGTALSSGIAESLKALSDQVTKADPDAQKAFEALVAARDSLAQPVEAGSVSIRRLGGQPVITVAPDGAREAAGLFDTLWRQTAVSGNIVVKSARMPTTDGDIVPLTSLGETGGNLDVVGRGEWSTTFDLGSDIPADKVPTSIDINVSAAPGATATKPVASVFINGTLLGAKQLDANGKPETISVAVPAYTLLPRNTIVVRFQRQPASDQCREVPQAYPVSVLPGSDMHLGPAPKADNFASIAARLSGDSLVGVRASWLQDATSTLPNVIDIANASAISPEKAAFNVIDTASVAQPEKPFLLFGTTVDGAHNLAQIDGDSISIATDKGATLFDASGLSGVAVLAAETGGKRPGLIYQTAGTGPSIGKPIQLGAGDVAVIGNDGVLSEISTNGASQAVEKTTDRLSQQGQGFSFRSLANADFWLHQVPGILTAAIIGGFLLLLILARSAKRRNRDDRS